jgi:hypothetical protein
MAQLIASYPILYRAKQYRVGESLPTDDPEMTEAWIEAGTAVWSDGKKAAVKAVPAAAEAAVEGNAINAETAENLVGKVPKTATRKKK